MSVDDPLLANLDPSIRISDPRHPYYRTEGSLYDHEIRWRDRAFFLESRGYLLRPRLRPGWQPSWVGTNKRYFKVEDGITTPLRDHLIDATRLSDGKMVYIKRVQTGDLESRIAIKLSTEALRSDPKNHSVPILDTFVDSEDSQISYIVMPFLKSLGRPEFEFIGEFLDFGEQILEGLTFLHENGIAHRDCASANIMMDASAMFPQGFHPISQSFLADMSDVAPSYSRLSAGVKYYFVDYGISSEFPLDSDPASRLVVGTLGRDQEPPELSDTVPYDPFKLDIFVVGNVFRREYYEVAANLDFLRPFVLAMTKQDPNMRPSAHELLEQWRLMRRNYSAVSRHWRIRLRAENVVERLVWDGIYSVRLVVHFLKWLGGKRYPGA
ncbi:hypothetical protein FA95DRAFT_1527043 [Auriscalpium vulgare]|uniref:Uncharacterized protein n=1 Tax=Auriscalpium vulgare TaxID=40419 RepID=A0ACB8RBM0_9AGAM|nr:hypothetical protein FA95DRAFT_1527043 [Auriscalpium vulgare]